MQMKLPAIRLGTLKNRTLETMKGNSQVGFAVFATSSKEATYWL
jgi:hypothetical protein